MGMYAWRITASAFLPRFGYTLICDIKKAVKTASYARRFYMKDFLIRALDERSRYAVTFYSRAFSGKAEVRRIPRILPDRNPVQGVWGNSRMREPKVPLRLRL